MSRRRLLVLTVALSLVACKCEGPAEGEDAYHWTLVDSLGDHGLALPSVPM